VQIVLYDVVTFDKNIGLEKFAAEAIDIYDVCISSMA